MEQMSAEMYGQLLKQLGEGGTHLLGTIEVVTHKGATHRLQQYIAHYAQRAGGQLPLAGEERARLDAGVAKLIVSLGGNKFEITENMAALVEAALRGLERQQSDERRQERLEERFSSMGISFVR